MYSVALATKKHVHLSRITPLDTPSIKNQSERETNKKHFKA